IAGYALPLKRTGAGWMSGAWFLRDDDILWLIPGDSAMGLRLPIDSIPWVSEKEYPWIWPLDPTEKLPALPSSEALKQPFIRGTATPQLRIVPGGSVRQSLREPSRPRGSRSTGEETDERSAPPLDPPDLAAVTGLDAPSRRPALHESAPWIIRTALC